MGSTADKKVVIITGATSGIGEALARHLHAKGTYNLVLTARTAPAGESLAASLDPSGSSVLFSACDVSSYASQSAVFRACWEKFGRLDAVVANAGVVDRGSIFNLRDRGDGEDVKSPLDNVPPEPSTGCTDTDLKGVVYGTVLGMHFMRHNPEVKRAKKAEGGREGKAMQQRGKIIYTGSMIGVLPCSTFPEYCASKAAVNMWTRCVAPVVMAKDGITVNCVMPGAVATSAMDFTTAFLPEHMTPMPLLMTAYDAYLDDDENSRTGETVEVAHDRIIAHDAAPNLSGDFGARTGAVFDPWFALVHGETSGLATAITTPTGVKAVV